MAAECYWCVSGKPRIPVPLGTTNNPIGCCCTCSALVCGHHGQRDRYRFKFECAICDPKLMTASASVVSDPDGTSLQSLLSPDRVLVFSGEDLFISFGNFEVRRPGYQKWLLEIRNLAERDSVRRFDGIENWSSSSKDARLLAVGAAYILVKLDELKVDVAAIYSTGFTALFQHIKSELANGN